MVFYLVGLGLCDEKDITVRGLEVVKKCKRVYLEAYTAVLMVDHTKLQEFYGREVIVADREMVEDGADEFLDAARDDDIALLVVGDPFGATTHTDLTTRCKEKQVPFKAIHNASIMNAIGCCGLQLYNYGRTVSIVFFTETWKPDSFYDKIKDNLSLGLHTLCLLDIKVKEQSFENMCRGRKVYEPPRYMTVNQCIEQLLEIEEQRKEGVCTAAQRGVGLARVGSDDQQIVAGTFEQLRTIDFGGPLHSFVIVGKTDEVEEEMLSLFNVASVAAAAAESQ